MKLEYGSLNEHLWREFPVLRKAEYTQLIGGIEAGPYVVFGVLFNQYLVDAAIKPDLEAKRKVAAFIEDMAASQDDRIADLVTTEVLPTLLRSQETVDAYWPLLGKSAQRRLSLIAPRIASDILLPSL